MKKIDPYHLTVLILIIAGSIAALFDKFQALTYFSMETREIIFVLDAMKLISVASIIMASFALRYKKQLFWPLNLSLGVNLLLAIVIVRSHLVVMFGLLLALSLVSYKDMIKKFDKVYLWTRICFFLIFFFLVSFAYAEIQGFFAIAVATALMLIASLATIILSIMHMKRFKKWKSRIFPIFTLIASGAWSGFYFVIGVLFLVAWMMGKL